MRIRRLRGPALLVAFALGAAVLAFGCGSGAGGIKTYTDSSYGYSFEYPAGWKLVKGDTAQNTSGAGSAGSVFVGDPNGAKKGNTGLDGLMVNVYKLNRVVDASMLPDVLPELEALLADLQSQDPSWKLEEALTQTSVAGLPSYRATFSFDSGTGAPLKTTSYFVFAGDIEYQLVVQSVSDNWQANQGVFDAFVASFKPGTKAQ